MFTFPCTLCLLSLLLSSYRSPIHSFIFIHLALLADIAPAAPADGSKLNRDALFAELNKGEAVTAGLRKVTADMQTHKNPALREHVGVILVLLLEWFIVCRIFVCVYEKTNAEEHNIGYKLLNGCLDTIRTQNSSIS